MTDDFLLFPDAEGGGGSSLDADIALLTAYVARELSLVQIVAVQERIGGDAAFRRIAWTIIEGWTVPGPAGLSGARRPTTTLSSAEIEAGWQRRVAMIDPPRPADGRSAQRDDGAIPHRRLSMSRIAALVTLTVLPMVAFAEVVTYAARHADVPGHSLAQRIAAPFERTRADANTPVKSERATTDPRVGNDLPAGRSLVQPFSAGDRGGVAALVGQGASDSAGIVIVNNPIPDWGRPAFHLGPSPVARFAADTTRDSIGVNLLSLIRLSDGRFVANDSRTSRLRFYDSRGLLLRTTGGRGGGNGQITLLQQLYLAPGDFIIGWQTLQAPYVMFDSEGSYVRNPFPAAPAMGRDMTGMTTPRQPAQIRGVFRDGTMLVDGIAPATTPYLTWRPMGESNDLRSPNVYLHVSADGSRLLDTLGYFPGNDRVPTYTFSQGTSPATGATVRNKTSLTIPGFRRSSVLADGDRMILAEGTTFEIRVYSTKGVLQRIIRVDQPKRAFTDADIARVKEEAVRNLTGTARESAIDALNQAAFPRVFAAFGRVMLDAGSRLWVESAEPGAPSGSWAVFDRDGKLLGTVQLPESRKVLWIGTDLIALSGTSNPRWGSEILLYRYGR